MYVGYVFKYILNMTIYFITGNKNNLKLISRAIRSLKYRMVSSVLDSKNEVNDQTNFDVLIAEIHGSNVDINYQIVLALTDKKPVLCVYPEGSNVEKSLPPTNGNIAKNLTIKPYNQTNLSDVVKNFLSSLKNGSEPNRFNFFLTRELEEYIKWVPFGKGMTKSNFIRRLIMDEMKKDKNYKAFTKDKK